MRTGMSAVLHSTLLVFAAACIIMFQTMTVVHAAVKGKAATSIQTVVGYGGYYKKTDWVPVTVTIHHPGKVHAAQITVEINQPLSNQTRLSGSLEWSVQLPKSGSITKQIEVPGNALSQGATIILRDATQTLASSSVIGNPVSHVGLVAVLSKTTQDTQFLAGTSIHSNPVLPVAVNPSSFPHNVNVLDSLAAVVASPASLRELTSRQQVALHTWVELGGLLIVSGTSADVPTLWNSALPLFPGAVKHANTQWIADFASSNGQMSKSTLSVRVGGISSTARLLAGTTRIPVLGSQVLGRGQVWQTAFSPMDPELLAWNGNPLLWTAVLSEGTASSDSGLPKLFNPSGALSLTSVGTALAPLRIPSLPIFAIVFGLYILLVGPVSFLVLRRMRRAHAAWFVLPLVSAVTTVSIYTFGALQRPNGLLVDGVGVVDLTGNGSAESYGVQAFMSPYPGGLDFTMPRTTLAVPMSAGEPLNLSDALVQYGAKTSLSFRNVERWHVRYLYAAGVNTHSGKLVAKLNNSYGLLFGSIQNQTPYTLENVAIVWEHRMCRLGTIKPGQTVSLNPTAEQQTSQWIADYGTYNRGLTRGIGRVLGAYLTQFSTTSSSTAPTDAMIIGTTTKRTAQLPQPEHAQIISNHKMLVLVRQFAPVTPGIGGASS